MRGRNTPDYVSTIMDVFSILMVVTLREEEEGARLQSGQEACAAVSTTRSTGGEEGVGSSAATATSAGLAVRGGDRGPGGRLYLGLPLSRCPKAAGSGEE
jgi:hypothetical protein